MKHGGGASSSGVNSDDVESTFDVLFERDEEIEKEFSSAKRERVLNQNKKINVT